MRVRRDSNDDSVSALLCMRSLLLASSPLYMDVGMMKQTQITIFHMRRPVITNNLSPDRRSQRMIGTHGWDDETKPNHHLSHEIYCDFHNLSPDQPHSTQPCAHRARMHVHGI